MNRSRKVLIYYQLPERVTEARSLKRRNGQSPESCRTFSFKPETCNFLINLNSLPVGAVVERNWLTGDVKGFWLVLSCLLLPLDSVSLLMAPVNGSEWHRGYVVSVGVVEPMKANEPEVPFRSCPAHIAHSPTLDAFLWLNALRWLDRFKQEVKRDSSYGKSNQLQREIRAWQWPICVIKGSPLSGLFVMFKANDIANVWKVV